MFSVFFRLTHNFTTIHKHISVVIRRITLRTWRFLFTRVHPRYTWTNRQVKLPSCCYIFLIQSSSSAGLSSLYSCYPFSIRCFFYCQSFCTTVYRTSPTFARTKPNQSQCCSSRCVYFLDHFTYGLQLLFKRPTSRRSFKDTIRSHQSIIITALSGKSSSTWTLWSIGRLTRPMEFRMRCEELRVRSGKHVPPLC